MGVLGTMQGRWPQPGRVYFMLWRKLESLEQTCWVGSCPVALVVPPDTVAQACRSVGGDVVWHGVTAL